MDDSTSSTAPTQKSDNGRRLARLVRCERSRRSPAVIIAMPSTCRARRTHQTIGRASMRGKGICYDTGFFNRGVSTHEPFDPEVVGRELRVIREDLRCNAVRITGGDLERLKVAASHAAAAGLEVWISPFTNDLTSEGLLDLLAGCAEHAERLRRQGAEIVLLTGSELTVCNKGIVPGETFEERVGLLTPSNPSLGELLAAVPARVNDLLGRAVRGVRGGGGGGVRGGVGGKVSYASLPFERVNWAPFDVTATDAGYRSAETADRYA